MIRNIINLNIPTSVGTIATTIAPNPSHVGFTVTYKITKQEMNKVRHELVNFVVKHMNENYGYNLIP